MPLESLLIVGGVVAAFLTFGITLAWADLSTAHLRQPRLPPR